MVLETIKPAVEKEKKEDSKLVRLLLLIKVGDFIEAREYADELIEQGTPQTTINHNCYDYFRRLTINTPEEAKKLAEVFENYHWGAWL